MTTREREKPRLPKLSIIALWLLTIVLVVVMAGSAIMGDFVQVRAMVFVTALAIILLILELRSR